MPTCSGDGECLYCPKYENEYIRHPKYACKYFCKPVKCSNFINCKTKRPLWEILCWGGECVICNLTDVSIPKHRPRTR
jgi:hypothetical protein